MIKLVCILFPILGSESRPKDRGSRFFDLALASHVTVYTVPYIAHENLHFLGFNGSTSNASGIDRDGWPGKRKNIKTDL